MCEAIALAPADVPANTAPRSCARKSASPSRVPATTDARRDWFPPVRYTPVAPCRVAADGGSSASSRSSGRRPVTVPMPSPRKSSRYISVA